LKVVLDEGVPEDLAQHLPGYDAKSVGQLGWKGTKNGALLKLLESISTEAFISADKNLEKQQSLGGRPFAVLLLSTNNWPLIQEHASAIAKALDECKQGMVLVIECGRFVPSRFRKRTGPGSGPPAN
jgi:hypothetical protein